MYIMTIYLKAVSCRAAHIKAQLYWLVSVQTCNIFFDIRTGRVNVLTESDYDLLIKVIMI